MGWIALLAAALYYHPWITATLIGVTVTLIGVFVSLRVSVSPWPCRRKISE
jgi:hypothetical protein